MHHYSEMTNPLILKGHYQLRFWIVYCYILISLSVKQTSNFLNKDWGPDCTPASWAIWCLQKIEVLLCWKVTCHLCWSHIKGRRCWFNVRVYDCASLSQLRSPGHCSFKMRWLPEPWQTFSHGSISQVNVFPYKDHASKDTKHQDRSGRISLHHYKLDILTPSSTWHLVQPIIDYIIFLDFRWIYFPQQTFVVQSFCWFHELYVWLTKVSFDSLQNYCWIETYSFDMTVCLWVQLPLSSTTLLLLLCWSMQTFSHNNSCTSNCARNVIEFAAHNSLRWYSSFQNLPEVPHGPFCWIQKLNAVQSKMGTRWDAPMRAK